MNAKERRRVKLIEEMVVAVARGQMRLVDMRRQLHIGASQAQHMVDSYRAMHPEDKEARYDGRSLYEVRRRGVLVARGTKERVAEDTGLAETTISYYASPRWRNRPTHNRKTEWDVRHVGARGGGCHRKPLREMLGAEGYALVRRAARGEVSVTVVARQLGYCQETIYKHIKRYREEEGSRDV